MAIMIPSVISPEVKSTAEKRIFEWFKSAPGTENWIVLHSLGIATHNRVIYGETDFFVLAPRLGLFALEVKGGRVRRESGMWYFRDKYDHENCKSRGPFDQAKEGVFNIVSAIKDKIDGNHSYLKGILFGYGVMMPDIEFAASGIDEAQWQVFDYRDGENVEAYIHRLYAGATQRWEDLYGEMGPEKLPTVEDVRYIASLLRGDFDCMVSLRSQLREANDSLLKLTEEQYHCLDQLEDNPRCLIKGPAGSGKTLLAIEAAKRAAANGEKVALFCFNSNLADWLSDSFGDLDSGTVPMYVGTFHRFLLNTAKKSENCPRFPTDPDKVPNYYRTILPQFVLSEQRERVVFDRIIVDEAQDLICEEYLAVLDCFLAKGLRRGKWILFGDFSMQAIYLNGITGQEMIEKIENYSAFIQFRLTINCRNTIPICKEIQTITGFKSPSSLWTKVDGPPVQYITWSDMEDQEKQLVELLRSLEEKHIYPEEITILSPKKRQDSVVARIHGLGVEDYHIPTGMKTSFCTIQAFKGLENTVIILTDIEDYSSAQLMYVGLSRARSGLYILESNKAKKEYDNLLIRRLLE